MRLLKVFLYISLIFLLSCNENEKQRISIKGSDTMLNFIQIAAEKYMQENENISISLSGGGSGIGVAALINGTAQIATISRDLRKREISQISKLDIKVKKIPVASDSVKIIANKNNPVQNLSLLQLKKIYSGEITNWNEVGGLNQKIVLYSRESSSGTFEFFRKSVLETGSKNHIVDFSTSLQMLQGTSAIAQAVALDANGIGYVGVGYLKGRDDLKILNIINPASADDILSRNLFCYLRINSKPEVEKFIAFLKSSEGQEIIKNYGFIPINE